MATSANGAATVVDVDGVGVRLTSPDKQVFEGITKRSVFDYYLAVGGRLIDQIGGRPTALERWPEGVAPQAEHFYQKHLPKKVPDFVHGLDVRFPSGRPGTVLDPDSRAAVAWAVQMGALTFHAWPVRAPDVEHPDQLRIDLDPPDDLDFDSVVTVAREVREVLTGWQWPAFLKTSGGRGLHIFVPVIATHSFIDVRHAAIAVGREVERRLPELVTMSWWKEERGGKVFIDFNQNAQDRVMASAYSLRPRPKAPVSMPISWSDLEGIQPLDFTLRTVPHLIATLPDPWKGMRDAAVDLTPALDMWQRDVDEGLPELPYPPDFPKMPGEPPRVQPSRARKPVAE
jgi:DNA ligase D